LTDQDKGERKKKTEYEKTGDRIKRGTVKIVQVVKLVQIEGREYWHDVNWRSVNRSQRSAEKTNSLMAGRGTRGGDRGSAAFVRDLGVQGALVASGAGG